MYCRQCGSQSPGDAIYCTNCGTLLGGETGDDMQGAIQRSTRGGLLAGRYRIVRELGRGGMGVVYLAEDAELRTEVGLKVLPDLIAKDQRSIEALRNEARIAMGLSHPNIMRLHTFESREECKFLVMEYIAGPTLDDVLTNQGRLSIEETKEIVGQVCLGLSLAHGQKVVHRDVKPSNVMLAFGPDAPYDPSRPLSEQGRFTVKVCDFGIARQVKDSLSRVSREETSGTLLYMSPEQLQGEPLDNRSDIYSLGATMYELLSGQPPFTSGSIHFQVLSKAPRPIEGIPEWLNTVVLRCLEKDRGARFETCEALAEAIAGGAGEGVPVEVEAVAQRGARSEESRKSPESVQVKAEEMSSSGLDAPSPARSRGTTRPRRRAVVPVIIAGAIALVIALVVGGYLHFQGWRYEKAQDVDRQVLDLSPESGEVEAEPVRADEGIVVDRAETEARERRDRIDALLRKADEHFSEDAFITPAGANAYDLYMEVLRLDPKNSHAGEMLDRMGRRYLEWGDGRLREGRFAEALDYYNRARKVGVSESVFQERIVALEREKDRNVGVEMVEIPAGTFRMGSPPDESGRHDNETLHTVTISKSFLMGRFEVTQGQWKAVMGSNPSHFKECGDECPVEQVSWFDAVLFCNRLSNREGFEPAYRIEGEKVTWDRGADGYRLPTEAEWEYACRAGTTTRFSTGDADSDLERTSWYKNNSGGKTHPVGRKTPNEWSLYDMHGNVVEWCWDRRGKYTSGTVTDPIGPGGGLGRVPRGCGWSSYGRDCRSAYRSGICFSSGRNYYLGFRLSRSARR